MEEKTLAAKEERRETRFERRLKDRKIDILNNIVNRYLADRTYVTSPEEGDELFRRYRDEWYYQCRLFNKGKKPFTLKHEAFKERVDYFDQQQALKAAKKAEEKLQRDIDRAVRNIRKWSKSQWVRNIKFWIIARGNKQKMDQLWRVYCTTQIMHEQSS